MIRTVICESAEGVRTCAVDGFDVDQTNTVFVITRRRVSTVTIQDAF